MSLSIQPFFHKDSGTFTYVVACLTTNHSAIIDPCYDFDLSSGTISTAFAQTVVQYIKDNNYKNQWILETHAHADHLSSAQWLKEQVGGLIGIGEGIVKVQQHFKSVFGFDDSFATDGSQFDQLLKEQELKLGERSIQVINTPGHTNDSVAYKIDNHLFVGDTVFAPNLGSARCDFPGGDAEALYESIQKIYSYQDHIIHLCHDYPKENNEPLSSISVAEMLLSNIQINKNKSKHEYIEARNKRDSTLAVPKLLYPAVQFNINAGKPFETSAPFFLKIPIKLK